MSTENLMKDTSGNSLNLFLPNHLLSSYHNILITCQCCLITIHSFRVKSRYSQIYAKNILVGVMNITQNYNFSLTGMEIA